MNQKEKLIALSEAIIESGVEYDVGYCDADKYICLHCDMAITEESQHDKEWHVRRLQHKPDCIYLVADETIRTENERIKALKTMRLSK